VIPTLLLSGALIGRWWLVAVAAVVWPALLIVTGVDSGAGFAVGARALGAANMAVGVAAHKPIVRLVRLPVARHS
jgi:hypothetical protein